MNETINNFKPFDTIAGINQIEEIENYILPETIIVTMVDIWSLYKKRFPKNIDVYFVNTLEEKELEREVSKFKNYKMIIGFGGGQALDIAKYFSWKKFQKKLMMQPSLMDVAHSKQFSEFIYPLLFRE